MNSVFLARLHVNYEGTQVLGVYTTRTLADEAITTHEAHTRNTCAYDLSDHSWSVREVTLNTPISTPYF